MGTYMVHLTHVVSTSRTVEAEDAAAAMDAAQSCGDLPTPGGRVGDDYDSAGEWEPSSVENAETGEEEWSEFEENAAIRRAHERDWKDQLDHANELMAEMRAELEKLRPIAARAQTAENWNGTGECPVCGEVSS